MFSLVAAAIDFRTCDGSWWSSMAPSGSIIVTDVLREVFFFCNPYIQGLLGLKGQRILDFLSWPCNCLGCWCETGKLWEPSAKNQLQCQNPELHIWGVLFQHPSKPPKWTNIFYLEHGCLWLTKLMEWRPAGCHLNDGAAQGPDISWSTIPSRSLINNLRCHVLKSPYVKKTNKDLDTILLKSEP